MFKTFRYTARRKLGRRQCGYFIIKIRTWTVDTENSLEADDKELERVEKFGGSVASSAIIERRIRHHRKLLRSSSSLFHACSLPPSFTLPPHSSLSSSGICAPRGVRTSRQSTVRFITLN
ncbi:hypothetical protein KPH14_004314 [Odynerus spinipes]|uniref:Uncharacterized protein n=1 Tax=Odynerus spinipes TaxID=1348599 RepID=A0AAD9RZ57_9HYME|nr:hypothetical protein KPH14_004314 [Odynerus spinipes]